MDEELDLKEALLIEAEGCLQDGDPEGALHATDEILAQEPQAAEAHHLRCMALRELGRPQEALAAVEAALRADPGFSEAAFSRAELLTFELADPAAALDVCDHFLRQDLEDGLYADFLSLKGNAFCELGDFAAAVPCFERAAELSPEREDSASRGWALFELGRMTEAAQALRAACQPGEAPNPANHFYLAVALTREGEERAAAKHFRIAARLAPDLHHIPAPIDRSALRRGLAEASALLPAALQSALEGLPVEFEPWPSLTDLGEGAEAVSPLAVLRLTGTARLASPGAPAARPESLVLYERNLSFVCVDEATVAEELHDALWAELVRFLDLDRDEVETHGLH